MENEKKLSQEKSPHSIYEKVEKSESGCCGGTATNNVDACCKLDEVKKAEGQAGCGCNSGAASTSKSSCCQILK